MDNICHYVDGDVIEVFSSEDLDQLKDPNCIIEQGVIIRFYVNESDEQPQNGEVIVEDIAVKKEIKKMDEQTKEEQVVQPQPEEVMQSTPQSSEVEQKQDLIATTETENVTAPFDINAILTSTGGGAGAAIVLAVIAILGGGAAWKFYQKISEQKHEQKMKELELKAQAQGLNGAQPPPCQAANAAIETKLAAMDAKLASVEKKTSSFSAGFDGEDIEDRLIKLEKKVKSLSART